MSERVQSPSVSSSNQAFTRLNNYFQIQQLTMTELEQAVMTINSHGDSIGALWLVENLDYFMVMGYDARRFMIEHMNLPAFTRVVGENPVLLCLLPQDERKPYLRRLEAQFGVFQPPRNVGGKANTAPLGKKPSNTAPLNTVLTVENFFEWASANPPSKQITIVAITIEEFARHGLHQRRIVCERLSPTTDSRSLAAELLIDTLLAHDTKEWQAWWKSVSKIAGKITAPVVGLALYRSENVPRAIEDAFVKWALGFGYLVAPIVATGEGFGVENPARIYILRGVEVRLGDIVILNMFGKYKEPVINGQVTSQTMYVAGVILRRAIE